MRFTHCWLRSKYTSSICPFWSVHNKPTQQKTNEWVNFSLVNFPTNHWPLTDCLPLTCQSQWGTMRSCVRSTAGWSSWPGERCYWHGMLLIHWYIPPLDTLPAVMVMHGAWPFIHCSFYYLRMEIWPRAIKLIRQKGPLRCQSLGKSERVSLKNGINVLKCLSLSSTSSGCRKMEIQKQVGSTRVCMVSLLSLKIHMASWNLFHQPIPTWNYNKLDTFTENFPRQHTQSF